MSAPSFAAAVARGGAFIADAVFITLTTSLAGYLGWHLADNPDWAAFVMIAGAVAALWALWAFVLFGIAAYFSGAAAFWRTLHPLNLTLAMLFVTCYTMLVYQKLPHVFIAFIVGGALFALCRRYLPLSPRTWLLLCLAILLLRYALPLRLASIVAAAAASFIGCAAWINYHAVDANNTPDKIDGDFTAK